MPHCLPYAFHSRRKRLQYPSFFSKARPPQARNLFPYTTLFRSRPGGDVVVDDGRLTSRFLLLEQLTQADQGRHRGRADRHPLLVDDEAPVGITVERQAQVSFLGDHRSEEHTSELQSRGHLVCRLLPE